MDLLGVFLVTAISVDELPIRGGQFLLSIPLCLHPSLSSNLWFLKIIMQPLWDYTLPSSNRTCTVYVVVVVGALKKIRDNNLLLSE